MERIFALIVCLALCAGCTTPMRYAREFDVSASENFFSSCDGELWTAEEANEKMCIRHSLYGPNTFLLTQDAKERWSDMAKGLALVVLDLYTQGAAGPVIKDLYDKYVGDDTYSRWLEAADQFMRKHYGANAEIANFERLGDGVSFLLEVTPGDQVPDWYAREPQPYVLASQMPEDSWQQPAYQTYALARLSRTNPEALRPGTPIDLTETLRKAVASSRGTGETNAHIPVDELSWENNREYLALREQRRMITIANLGR